MWAVRRKVIRLLVISIAFLVLWLINGSVWFTSDNYRIMLVDYNRDALEEHKRYEDWRRFSEVTTLNQTSFAIVMTEKDREVVLGILKYVITICEQHDIIYFITGGTLLGSWRHHGFIPWDDDVDVYVRYKDRHRLRQVLNKGTNDFYALLAYGRMKVFSETGNNTSSHPWLWPYIDVTFYHENQTHIWGARDEFPNEVYQRKHVFPLHMRPFENIYCKSPNDGYAFLVQTFDDLNCQSYFYSHKRESGLDDDVRVIPCSHFRNHLAFVYRHPAPEGTNGIVENLVIGNRTLHSITVNEPKYAITEPFSLFLVGARVSRKLDASESD